MEGQLLQEHLVALVDSAPPTTMHQVGACLVKQRKSQHLVVAPPGEACSDLEILLAEDLVKPATRPLAHLELP